MHVDVYAWQGRVQCPVRLGSVEAVESFSSESQSFTASKRLGASDSDSENRMTSEVVYE